MKSLSVSTWVALVGLALFLVLGFFIQLNTIEAFLPEVLDRSNIHVLASAVIQLGRMAFVILAVGFFASGRMWQGIGGILASCVVVAIEIFMICWHDVAEGFANSYRLLTIGAVAVTVAMEAVIGMNITNDIKDAIKEQEKAERKAQREAKNKALQSTQGQSRVNGHKPKESPKSPRKTGNPAKIQEAIRKLEEQGKEKITVEDIADALGVSVRTYYRMKNGS